MEKSSCRIIVAPLDILPTPHSRPDRITRSGRDAFGVCVAVEQLAARSAQPDTREQNGTRSLGWTTVEVGSAPSRWCGFAV